MRLPLSVPDRLVALRLNRFENHRTDSDFDDALTVKTWLFQSVSIHACSSLSPQFLHLSTPSHSSTPHPPASTPGLNPQVNSYISLFYIAFVKASAVNPLMAVLQFFGVATEQYRLNEYCHDYSRYGASLEVLTAAHGGLNPFCMSELSIQIATLTISSELTGKLLEYVVPRAKASMRVFLEEQAMIDARHGAAGDGADRGGADSRGVNGTHEAWHGDMRHEPSLLRRAGRWLMEAWQLLHSMWRILWRSLIGGALASGGRQGFSVAAATRRTSIASGAADESLSLPSMTFYEEQAKLEPFAGACGIS